MGKYFDKLEEMTDNFMSGNEGRISAPQTSSFTLLMILSALEELLFEIKRANDE